MNFHHRETACPQERLTRATGSKQLNWFYHICRYFEHRCLDRCLFASNADQLLHLNSIRKKISDMTSFWPYHFQSLTPEQVRHRRELLDLRGFYAQCLAIILILIVRAAQTWKRRNNNDQNSSTGEKSWWDFPPVAGWQETRRQYAGALVWLASLMSLAIWRTGGG